MPPDNGDALAKVKPVSATRRRRFWGVAVAALTLALALAGALALVRRR